MNDRKLATTLALILAVLFVALAVAILYRGW